ncbi:hypothetical protein AJ79_04695 [Helicocarpus griseus UAMH5409]|uniref:DNA (cytosine-5-)-methyltransferase n=1 Tax=Helicocarpus griseus UAMH5409 TaxID=1447875 RepID=A0A2B7XJ80_9EURO|nr:hypothetical protein AJ79_04695 [Helicocarpus griseus UAMH5409]
MTRLLPGQKPIPLTTISPRSRNRLHRERHEVNQASRIRQPSPIILDESDSSATLSGDEEDYASRFNENDFMDDEQLGQFLSNITAGITPRVTQSLHAAKEVIPEYVSNGRTYKAGKSVELHDGTFLRILEVVRVERGGILLRGRRLQRQEGMDGLLPEHINELCWIINLPAGQTATSMDEVDIHEVKGLRIIRFTNRPYSASVPEDHFATEDDQRQEGTLFCRLKYIRTWIKSSGRKEQMEEQAILFLSPDEADPGHSVDSEVLQFQWRGETTPGGSHVHRETSPPIIDLSQASPTVLGGTTKEINQYTFGDGFCGAGGVSQGALQAGLRVSWGFDHSVSAMNSFRLNFDDAMGYTCDVAHFLANPPEEVIVDILHFSPPCQPFSPAHTVASAMDDANEACIFCTGELLKLTKPRIVTMEETSGLPERHKGFLFATIHTMAELGFSCRWKVLNCQDYGVPQSRKRLVVFASAPGETLPPFPKPTHVSPDSTMTYLPRYRTIHDAISNIPARALNHDIQNATKYNPPKPRYNPHTRAKTITCNSGEGNYHPSGERAYTYRELACLQTFPLDHKFSKTNVRKQIGNAVPPMLGKVMFTEIRKALERADGVAVDEMDVVELD